MKIGYPTLNLALGCSSSHTFRLQALSERLFAKTVAENIACLKRLVAWNSTHRLLFFRIASGLIPFASHPQMTFPWQAWFGPELAAVGALIREYDMRISMHPGHFVVLTSPVDSVYQSSIAELAYHAEVFELLGLDMTHKMQIHFGGMYGDRQASVRVFRQRYEQLPTTIRRRLVIENDERLLTVRDCRELSRHCGIPVLFDTLHHQLHNNGESLVRGLDMALPTWTPADGVAMVDYSNQDPSKRPGAHAQTLDVEQFRRFVKSLKQRDIDIMFEIKNKEASALQARALLDNREES